MGDREVDQDQGKYNYKRKKNGREIKKMLKQQQQGSGSVKMITSSAEAIYEEQILIYGEQILITKGLASFFLQ